MLSQEASPSLQMPNNGATNNTAPCEAPLPLDQAVGERARVVVQKGGQIAWTAAIGAGVTTKKAVEAVRKIPLTRWGLAALAWELVCLCWLIPMYLGPTADGLKLTIPSMSRRMYRHNIIGRLFDTPWGYRLTAADLWAVGILIMATILWYFLIRDRVLHTSAFDERFASRKQFMGMIRTLAWLVLAADALLFFVGILGSRGWSLWGVVCALAGTSLYVGSLVFVSLVAVWILYQKERSQTP